MFEKVMFYLSKTLLLTRFPAKNNKNDRLDFRLFFTPPQIIVRMSFSPTSHLLLGGVCYYLQEEMEMLPQPPLNICTGAK